MTPAVDAELLERVRARIAEEGGVVSAQAVAAAMRAEGGLVGDVAVLEMVDALQLDAFGAGPLEPLLRRPGVTDVLVNGPDEVYLDDGAGLRRSEVRFLDESAVRRLAQRLASSAGRRLDDSVPFVDVRLRDGTRFHAVLSPLASPGTCLSLRVPTRRALTLDQLVGSQMVDADGARLLLDIVAAESAFVISGGTGTGKTTLLAALLSHVASDQRIVIVEDAAELRPAHPHVVSLEGRPANVEGAGEVTLQQLVRQALRMRPDRLVVGEVRGAEVVDLLAALNTGHEGGCGTIHANSAVDVPARFEALGVAAGLDRRAVHAQVAAAVQVVIHLRRGRDGIRRVDEIAVVTSEGGIVRTETAVQLSAGVAVRVGPAGARLAALLSSDRTSS
jgi:pilus assembly protein CpaF